MTTTTEPITATGETRRPSARLRFGAETDTGLTGVGEVRPVNPGRPHPREGVMVEMGESRTPRPEPFAGDHYERVR